jgi:hypothetical protein
VELKKSILISVKVLGTCFVVVQCFAFAGPEHEHEHDVIGGRKPPAAADDSGGFADSRCQVSAKRLADFANGDAYDYRNLVNYLTVPTCQATARAIGRAAAASGVQFKAEGPYRLDGYSKSLTTADLESSRNAEIALAKSIPQLLRTDPLGSNELLPVLGQLAILSPQAARSTLSYLIQTEIQNGDDRWTISPADLRPQIAVDLSQTLLSLGANRAMISNDLANAVGEMVLMEQAESLGKYFHGLALAAQLEESLIPTFNLSASSFARAVGRTNSLASPEGRAALLKSAFLAAQSALEGPAALEVGAREFNESLAKLLDGKAVSETALRKLWKAVMVVLSKNANQTALAEAVALSITPQMMFLEGPNRTDLMKAASQYPALSEAVQAQYLVAHLEMWGRMADKKISVAAFNRMREKYLKPMVSEILQFDPALIDNNWLREVAQKGMIAESEVEKRFPKLMLAQLKRREKATSQTQADAADKIVQARAENMAVLLALSQVHIPALERWVVRQEKP